MFYVNWALMKSKLKMPYAHSILLGLRTSRLEAFSVIEVHHIRRKTLSTKKEFLANKYQSHNR